MDKRYFRNTTNTTVALYDINTNVDPGCIISVITSQVEKSANLAYFLAKGIMEEVDKKATAVRFKSSGTPDVVLPAGVVPEKRIVASVVTLGTEEGAVIQGGKLPGEGTLKPLKDVINDGIKTLQDNMNKAAPVVAPASAEPNEPTDTKIPESLKTWFTYSLNIKKSQIIRYTDMNFLMYIAKHDKDAKVQKLISQRLKELSGVDEEAADAKLKKLKGNEEEKEK
jgi:hypothetical protein